MDTTATAPPRQPDIAAATVAARDAPDDRDDRPPYLDWEAPAERRPTGPSATEDAYWLGYTDAIRHLLMDGVATVRPAQARVTDLRDADNSTYFAKGF